MTKRISQLTALTGVDVADAIPIVDNSTSTTKKVTVGELRKNIYAFAARRNAAANTGNNAFAKIAFDTEDYDDNSNFDAVTNNRYVAPVNGLYTFHARFSCTTTSTNQSVIVALYKNGTEVYRGARAVCPTSATIVGVEVVKDLKLSATDYIEAYAFGTVALAMEVTSAALQPALTGHLVCPT